MGLQLIVKEQSTAGIRISLGEIFEYSEIFQIEKELFGISIPTEIVDRMGEKLIFKQLKNLEYYSLWSGKWHKPKKKLFSWLKFK